MRQLNIASLCTHNSNDLIKGIEKEISKCDYFIMNTAVADFKISGDTSKKIPKSKFKNFLNENIEYVENSKLVRGLDYYSHLTFEVVCKATVVGGGGRYDKLAESLKLGNSAGVGVAFGVDRIINCINYVSS